MKFQKLDFKNLKDHPVQSGKHLTLKGLKNKRSSFFLFFFFSFFLFFFFSFPLEMMIHSISEKIFLYYTKNVIASSLTKVQFNKFLKRMKNWTKEQQIFKIVYQQQFNYGKGHNYSFINPSRRVRVIPKNRTCEDTYPWALEGAPEV
jgi:hypothetical protein